MENVVKPEVIVKSESQNTLAKEDPGTVIAPPLKDEERAKTVERIIQGAQAWSGYDQDLPQIDVELIEQHIELTHSLAGDFKGLITLSRLKVGARLGRREGGLQSRPFAVGDTAGMLGQAIAWAQEPGTNVYIGNAVLRPDLEKGRGKDSDVIRVLALVLDSDADKGKVAHVEGLVPNFVITTSTCPQGENTQLYFVIDDEDATIAPG